MFEMDGIMVLKEIKIIKGDVKVIMCLVMG